MTSYGQHNIIAKLLTAMIDVDFFPNQIIA
jgi:hypothetical protein